MFTFASKLLKYIPQPYRLIVQIGSAVLLIVLAIYLFGSIRSCQYDKARKEYQQKEDAAKAERDKLLGQIAQRDKEIAELEIEKQAFKTMAENGVRSDAEKAKQIEEISAKEAQDLESVRKDMDCATRARNTVELLRTAKPPINLDVNAVIRKQCGTG